METINGLITEKNMKSGTNAVNGQSWTRAEFVINGAKYSTFDRKIIDNFNVGQNVKITGQLGEPTASGKQYWDMVNMELSTDTTAPVPNVAPAAPQDQFVKAEKEFSETNDILRQILAELKLSNGNN